MGAKESIRKFGFLNFINLVHRLTEFFDKKSAMDTEIHIRYQELEKLKFDFEHF